MDILNRSGKVLIAVLLLYGSWLMLQLTLPYLELNRNVDFLKTKELIYHIIHWRVSFYVHVFTGIFALVVGIFQFSGYVIRHQKRLHRITGYIYVFDVLFVTGPAAFIMAWYANGGLPARISFVLLAALWMYTTAMAWRLAANRRFNAHGEWMLRSYALTLSALTLRTYALLFGLLRIDMRPVDIYITIAWLSWIPNLLVAETMIARGYIRSLLRSS